MIFPYFRGFSNGIFPVFQGFLPGFLVSGPQRPGFRRAGKGPRSFPLDRPGIQGTHRSSEEEDVMGFEWMFNRFSMEFQMDVQFPWEFRVVFW